MEAPVMDAALAAGAGLERPLSLVFATVEEERLPGTLKLAAAFRMLSGTGNLPGCDDPTIVIRS